MIRPQPPAEMPVRDLLRRPLEAMEIEDGAHVTLKFHLPYRLLTGAPGAMLEAEQIAAAEVRRLVTSLVEERYRAEPPKEAYVPPPIPVGTGKNPNDGDECLACQ